MDFYLAKKSDYSRLIDLWERSVRATHKFLSEEDILDIKAQLPIYFDAVKLLVWEDETRLIGFSGTNGKSLEMLFLDDQFQGQGFGKQIISYLISNDGIKTVDVNEDNPNAFAFYKAVGFEEIGKSELDDQGRPFPIIHLKLK